MKIKLGLKFEDGRQIQEWYNIPVHIGRLTANDLVIKSWRVAKEHALIVLKDGQLFIQDLGSLSGTILNNQRIYHLNPLAANEQIIIGPCLLEVLQLQPIPSQSEQIHVDKVAAKETDAQITVPKAEHDYDSCSIPVSDLQLTEASLPSVNHDEQLSLRKRLHAQLFDALDLRRNDVAQMHEDVLRTEVQRLLAQISQTNTEFKDYPDIEQICQLGLDEAVGLGPLEVLLKNQSISEIMVNRYDEIYAEQAGKSKRYPMSFSSEQSVLSVIDRIVAPIERRITGASRSDRSW